MKTTTEQKPIRKPTPKQAVALVRLVQRCAQRIGAIAEKKRIALEKLNLLNKPVEVDGEKFEVIEPRGRFVFNVKLDLVKIPRNPRSPKPADAGPGVTPAEPEAAE